MLPLILAALTLLPSTMPVQGEDSKQSDAPTTKAAAQKETLEYDIRVLLPYLLPGDTVDVSYSIKVNADTTINASILCGTGIDIYVEGKKVGAVLDAPAGESMMPVRKGTILRGMLPLAVNDLVRKSDLQLSKTKNLELELGFGPKAKATIKIVPDMRDYPLDKLDLTKTQVVILTDFGAMVAEFFPEQAPNHVKRFIGLAQKRYYDGIQFHRIMKNFMIQGGDYHTRAAGSPSDMGAQAPLKAEFNDTKHVKGILSMARLPNDINSGSTQFFLMHGRAPYLDGQYSVFGKVVEGLEVIDKLASQPVERNRAGEISKPVEPLYIRKMIVLGVPTK